VLSGLEGSTGSALTWRLKDTPSGRLWWVLGRSGLRTDEIACGSSDDWQTPNTLTGGQTSRGGDRKGELLLGGQVRRSCPTPTQDDAGGRTTQYKQGGTSLSAQMTDAANGLWASPQARDWKDSGPTQGNRKSPNLGTQAYAGLLAPESPSTTGKSHGWPTPVGMDVRESNDAKTIQRKVDGETPYGLELRDAATHSEKATRGTLNSRWVAQLMGYPSDWLDVSTERLLRLWATVSSRKSSRSSDEQ